ncbi:hypothetical protein SPLC1_S590690 [Arthrospira platensis C1]|nr:hypothetical protein SPLC1_S590690 [Arthrospira platensis C1]
MVFAGAGLFTVPEQQPLACNIEADHQNSAFSKVEKG